MEIIKELPDKKGKKYSLFFCPSCKKELPLRTIIGRKREVCIKCVANKCAKRKALLLKNTKKKPQKEKRLCLVCDKFFMSKGPYNRRCSRCSTKIDYISQNHSFPEVKLIY